MKRDAIQHPKFMRLCQRLNLRRWQAVGLLETLWQFTAGYARRGDIGRYSNREIADWLGWEGDADELIDALVECGWLDRCAVHRLVVHDWAEHAERWIKLSPEVRDRGFAKPVPPSTAAARTEQPAAEGPAGTNAAGDHAVEPGPSHDGASEPTSVVPEVSSVTGAHGTTDGARESDSRAQCGQGHGAHETDFHAQRNPGHDAHETDFRAQRKPGNGAHETALWAHLPSPAQPSLAAPSLAAPSPAQPEGAGVDRAHREPACAGTDQGFASTEPSEPDRGPPSDGNGERERPEANGEGAAASTRPPGLHPRPAPRNGRKRGPPDAKVRVLVEKVALRCDEALRQNDTALADALGQHFRSNTERGRRTRRVLKQVLGRIWHLYGGRVAEEAGERFCQLLVQKAHAREIREPVGAAVAALQREYAVKGESEAA